MERVTSLLGAVITESWAVMLDLSPSLLLGLLIAGLLHVFLPRGLIRQRLSGSGTRNVFEAVLIGVPMPLCSCGVVPTAMGLKHQGASSGAATGFLISTPQTGVDSVLVSASFLGWPFALFKVVAAFVTGMIGGILVNVTEPRSRPDAAEQLPAAKPPIENRFKEIFRYSIFEILGSIDIWIVIGVLVSVAITLALPAGYLAEVGWIQGIGGMGLVLAIALPLYVCTTGSVPIAASLIAAGMPVGSALVFLMAGPATNAATMGAVLRTFGWRVLGIYLGTTAALSIVFGLLFDFVLSGSGAAGPVTHEHGVDWLAVGSAVALLALLGFLLGRRIVGRIKRWGNGGELDPLENAMKVNGMTCAHCEANVKQALEAVPGVDEALPDREAGVVVIKGEAVDRSALVEAVEKAGFQVAES